MHDESDSLLSAYFDDESTPDERHLAEQLLSMDPLRVEELKGVAGVHDLIADLSRPVPLDLTPGVLARIARSTLKPRRARLRRAVGWTAAAGILLTASLFVARPRTDVAPPPVVSNEIVAIHPSRNSIAELVGPPWSIQSAETVEQATNSDSPSGLEVVDVESSTLASLDLVEHPGPYRRFLVSVPVDVRQVAAVLETTSHRGFCRLDLPPTSHDGGDDAPEAGAVVFAAELDSIELVTLRSRLAASFPGRFDEVLTSAAALEQAAEHGRLTMLPSNPVADVLIPQTKMALKASPDESPLSSDTSSKSSVPEEPPFSFTEEGRVPEHASLVVLIWISNASAD